MVQTIPSEQNRQCPDEPVQYRQEQSVNRKQKKTGQAEQKSYEQADIMDHSLITAHKLQYSQDGQNKEYITQSQSTIHTERSLVYLAMSTSRSIHLFKPDANFMLVKLLKDDITAADVAMHCNQRGIIIRKCDDFRGLDNNFIRFCFMKPKQNDLMVNTILEIV